MRRSLILVPLCAAMMACSSREGDVQSNNVMQDNAIAAQWPNTLKPFGKGYPVDGSPCRRVGESPAVADYLDDSAILVGCPSDDTARALTGKIVGKEGDIILVSVGNDAGLPPGEPAYGMGDAKTPDGYHATTTVPCGIEDKLDSDCWAGVKRNEGPDGTSFVEVKKPDGMKRILFFQGTKASGADSNQADGSASYRFKWHREADWTVIEYGPERYRIPDALVVGG